MLLRRGDWRLKNVSGVLVLIVIFTGFVANIRRPCLGADAAGKMTEQLLLSPPSAEPRLGEIYNIQRRLLSVLKVCGALCQTDRVTQAGPIGVASYHNFTTSFPVDCRGMYESADFYAPRESSNAPRSIPGELLHQFTMGGRIAVETLYFDQAYLENGHRVLNWTKNVIEQLKEEARRGTLRGTYGVRETVRTTNSAVFWTSSSVAY
jgi:hypothetical protein